MTGTTSTTTRTPRTTQATTATAPAPRSGTRPAASAPAPTVPRQARPPLRSTRPAGPAGTGPGRGPGGARTAPGRRPARGAAAPLPTVGAQRRAHTHRPHHWFAQQLLLTLSGQRPVHALLGHTLPAAYDKLAELAPQEPLRPAPTPGRRAAVPALPAVRDCGLCRPAGGVIEAFARIATGERLRALAFRLELGADSRWRCAALDIGPAPRRTA